MSESNKIVVYAALFGNLAIALVKFVASYITNSSAMFSEAIHSVVDTLNEILLLYGMKNQKNRQMPNILLVMGVNCILGFYCGTDGFALGAIVSIYQGIQHILQPEVMRDPLINYIVLGLAILLKDFHGQWL